MFKVLLLALLFSFPSYAETVKNTAVDYDLYAGGIRGVSANLELIWRGAEYEVKTTTETRGFIGFLYPLTAVHLTKGIVKAERAFPQSYVATSVSRSKKTVKELAYDEQGRVIEQTNLRRGEETSKDIADDKGYGESLDYQSVVAMMLSRLDQGLDCNQSYVSFDGKRRYYMIFEDHGFGRIEKSRYSNFSGVVRECTLKVEPFNNDYPSNSWFWHRSGKGRQLPIRFWTAKMGGLTVPVRIEIDSLGFGTIIAHIQLAGE